MAVTLLWAVLWGLLATAATQFSLPSAQLLRMAPDRPQCSPVVGDRCVVSDYAGDEYFYTVNGQHHRIEFSEGGYYKAKCKAVALGDAAQPAFKRRKIFADVTLEGCAPPANASYADALAALNITVTQRLILTGLPKDTRLTAASFARLPPLQALELTHSSDSVIVLEEGVLEPLAALRRLLLVLVRPARLPPRLAKLRLRYTGLRALPKEALNVVELEVVEDDLTDMGGPFPRLDTLTLSASVVSAPVAPALRRASISRWQDAAPGAWRDCDRLEVLSLTQAAARRLPAGFVAACGRLHTLELQMMQAEELPESFLFNASALTKFKAANWPLKTLPPDLFEYSPRLEEIDLSNNGLESLPSGLFAPVVSSLRKLSLARNKLTANDVRLTVAPLTALLELNLANNALGDLCPASSANVYSRSVSYLSGLKQLEQLMLSRTQAPRVCADWMHHMHSLKRLDLTYNRIEELQFADLKIQRKVSPADVDVSHNPLRAVRCSHEDYLLAADDAIPKQTARLVMDSPIACTCETYWLARALRERRVAAAFDPECAAPRDPPGRSILKKYLSSVPLSALVCELPPDKCATNCTCVVETHLGGLRVTCRGVDDLRLDNLTSEKVDVKQVYATGVKRLPTTVPATIKLLDLSNSSIQNASAEAAAALFAHGARVRLARNPLQCDCGNRGLLDALHANQALVLEYANTTCSDNRTVSVARAALQCTRRSWALGALVALCVAALAAVLAAALLARPETRLRIKAFLHSRGVRARWLAKRLEPADEDRIFDAFVAHSSHDQRFVAETLARTLESGPRPHRLCLDYRDWPAGAWIPTQIEDSIRYSRRTVALVSKHFLSSRWARAELRAAHAAAIRERAPRIIIILLDVAAAELDDELRALVAAHAAVRWGEPWFWEKLRYALPDARDPAWHRARADWPERPDPQRPPAAA